MSAHWWSWSLVALAVTGPVACGDDKTPPGPADWGGSTGNGTGATHSAGKKQNDGGEAPAVAGNGNVEPMGGAGPDLPPIGDVGGEGVVGENGGMPPDLPARCKPAEKWANPKSLDGISTPGADELLLAITHDEKTLVFSRGDDLFVADRSSADVDFGTEVLLTLPDGYVFARGVALTPDGLALTLVDANGYAFAEVTRVARSGAFGTEPSTARFAEVNDAQKFSHDILSNPVLSEDGKSFYYGARKASSTRVWQARGGASFSSLTQLDPVALGAEDGKAKLPLSVASDERALFVLDEAVGHVAGLWSLTAQAELAQRVDFADLQSAFTSTDCGRLYGTRKVDASLDVVVESPR